MLKNRHLDLVFYHLSNGNINLLSLEFGKLRLNLGPGLAAINQRLDGLQDLSLLSSDLGGRITISQRNGAVLEGLEVDSDAERCSELVVSTVSLADTGG